MCRVVSCRSPGRGVRHGEGIMRLLDRHGPTRRDGYSVQYDSGRHGHPHPRPTQRIDRQSTRCMAQASDAIQLDRPGFHRFRPSCDTTRPGTQRGVYELVRYICALSPRLASPRTHPARDETFAGFQRNTTQRHVDVDGRVAAIITSARPCPCRS